MGWLFTPNSTRQTIIDGLIQYEENEHGIWETLRHCTRGNALWSIIKWTDKKTNVTRHIIGCHLLEKSVENYGQRKVVSWGYKSMDEAMHPIYYSCPLSYLKDAPIACKEWRDKVIQYHRKSNIGDDDKHLHQAKNYARNLKRRLAKATAENDKVALAYLHQEAKVVLRKLRQNIDGLQEMLEQAEAKSSLTSSK